jgi:protein-tyrosine phosphatase
VNDIYWIKDGQPPRLAIVARPRGDDWLREDLTRLRDGGIDILVSFLPADEEWALGLSEERTLANQLGMQFISYPIPDREVPPDPAEFRQFVAYLAGQALAGKKIGAHCRGCIGRSTLLIASIMIALGSNAEDALRQIAAARGLDVPDTPEQRAWILRFRPGPVIANR